MAIQPILLCLSSALFTIITIGLARAFKSLPWNIGLHGDHDHIIEDHDQRAQIPGDSRVGIGVQDPSMRHRFLKQDEEKTNHPGEILAG